MRRIQLHRTLHQLFYGHGPSNVKIHLQAKSNNLYFGSNKLFQLREITKRTDNIQQRRYILNLRQLRDMLTDVAQWFHSF